jgi:hypothetical protein
MAQNLSVCFNQKPLIHTNGHEFQLPNVRQDYFGRAIFGTAHYQLQATKTLSSFVFIRVYSWLSGLRVAKMILASRACQKAIRPDGQ